MADKVRFKLFISGMSVKSIQAVENIKKIGDKYLKDSYELEIIDLVEKQEKAEEFQIIAVPTLMREFPNPKRIILGDLSDEKKVLKILELGD